MATADYLESLAVLAKSPVGLIFAALLGGTWGSFANVCIHRIPQGLSVARPASFCPSCQVPIGWVDNVPLLSWLMLRGRCRRCQARIGARYFLVELLATGLSVLLYLRFVQGDDVPLGVGLSRFVVYLLFAMLLLVLSGIDSQTRLLPDRLTLPAIPLFFGCGRLLGQVTLADALVGVMAGYGIVWLIATTYQRLRGRDGLGLGDGKLLSLIGGLLGWHALPFTLFVGSMAGLLFALPLSLLRKKSADEAQESVLYLEIPFGPFLSLAAIGYLLLLTGRDPMGRLLSVLSRV
jgi:leader peptidase (prepilin peptidase)/N-methyltransferase